MAYLLMKQAEVHQTSADLALVCARHGQTTEGSHIIPEGAAEGQVPYRQVGEAC